MADMRIHNMMMTPLADPLGISGCVFWHPCDRLRYRLPTGQVLRNLPAATQEFINYNGVRCLHQTAVGSGANSQYFYVPEGYSRPMTAGYNCGNGCTVSYWAYGRNNTGNNPFQVCFYDSPTPDLYTSYSGIVLLSHTANLGMSEYTTTSDVRYTIANDALPKSRWNNICVTVTAEGAITLYVNKTSKTTATANLSGWLGGLISCPNRACTGYFAGYRLYDRVLTSTERTTLYNEYAS